MAQDPTELHNNPGDIRSWPILKVDYPTDPTKVAALLPPGIEPSDTTNVHLSFYNVPVPDEPESGLKITVDADYDGTKGEFALCYAIDQEAAVWMSANSTGQPKVLATLDYYRLIDKIRARCTHQGYTFAEYSGKITGLMDAPEGYEGHEWWIKSSRSASMTPGEWDFPPHVVTVHDKFAPKLWQKVEGELILRESPWDPIADLLPVKGEPSARLVNEQLLAHDIALAKPLDPQAFEPFASTISSSRWPGVMGGPTREVDYSAYLT